MGLKVQTYRQTERERDIHPNQGNNIEHGLHTFHKHTQIQTERGRERERASERERDQGNDIEHALHVFLYLFLLHTPG